MIKIKGLLVLLILVIFMAGCSPLVGSDQEDPNFRQYQLSATQSVGQSFVPHFAGLRGIQIYLSPEQTGDGLIKYYLRTGSNGEQDLASGTFKISEIKDAKFYQFNFAPINELKYERYYFVMEIEGNGSVLVGAGDKRAYIEGAIYIQDEPVESQMAFRLVYDIKFFALGLGKEILDWGYKFLLSLFVFMIPGLALMNFLWPASKQLSKFERIALSIGLSIAIYPILFLITSFIGIRLGIGYALLPLLVGITYLVWSNWSGIKERFKKPLTISLNIQWKETNFWQNFTLVFILLLIFLVRFWVIRGLAGPMWGDSYQHTMMSQLLVDNNGLFNSWMPYAQLGTFTYHFGFHSNVAVFHWFSGINVSDSVLWVGQMMNGFSVFALYPLVMRFNRKSRWGAIIAVLIAGLLLTYPMYYVNWGRYTQLAGQVILPVAMVFLLELFSQKELKWKLIFLCSLCMAGLALTHYRVFLLSLPLVALGFIINVTRGKLKVNFLGLLYSTFIAIVILAPWVINTINSNLDQWAINKISAVEESQYTFVSFSTTLYQYLPDYIWGLYFLAIIYSLWTHNLPIISFVIWGILIIFMTNPAWLNLPGNRLIDTLSVLIGYYIPATIAIGLLFDDILNKVKKWNKYFAIPLLILICLTGLYGVSRQRSIADPLGHAVLTWPDRNAIAWIKENIPLESKILVNYEFSYGGSAITGMDGGWWIPLLTQRQTNLPPLTFTMENGIESDFYSNVMDFGRKISESDFNENGFINFLVDQGYGYIYIGQNPLFTALLTPEKFIASDKYSLVYHQDQVWIFKILAP